MDALALNCGYMYIDCSVDIVAAALGFLDSWP